MRPECDRFGFPIRGSQPVTKYTEHLGQRRAICYFWVCMGQGLCASNQPNSVTVGVMRFPSPAVPKPLYPARVDTLHDRAVVHLLGDRYAKPPGWSRLQ